MLLVLYPSVDNVEILFHLINLLLNMCKLFALVLQLDRDVEDDLNRIERLRNSNCDHCARQNPIVPSTLSYG